MGFVVGMEVVVVFEVVVYVICLNLKLSTSTT